jgi:hypothetical protein
MLARSYELGERISSFANEVDRRITVLTPPHPHDPGVPRVMCPECGKRMRLKTVEPQAGSSEKQTFECFCKFVYEQTVGSNC